MANFFKNKAKLFLIIYLILIGATIIFGLAFMTSYANIHVVYKLDNGVFDGFGEGQGVIITSTGVSNIYAIRYFNNAQVTSDNLIIHSRQFLDEYAYTVYDFEQALNSFNTYFLIAGLVSLASIAVLFITANSSRRIYYKSNLIAGMIVPLIVSILMLVAMIQLFGLIATFSANQDLFIATSALMNPIMKSEILDELYDDWELVKQYGSDANVATLVVALIVSIVVIAYSFFVAIFSIRKYKKDEKERNEIIERAATAND